MRSAPDSNSRLSPALAPMRARVVWAGAGGGGGGGSRCAGLGDGLRGDSRVALCGGDACFGFFFYIKGLRVACEAGFGRIVLAFVAAIAIAFASGQGWGLGLGRRIVGVDLGRCPVAMVGDAVDKLGEIEVLSGAPG